MKSQNKIKLLTIATYILDFDVTFEIENIYNPTILGWTEGNTVHLNIEGILCNAFNWDTGGITYEEIGAIAWHTLGHEVRHVMQHRWNEALPQVGDYIDKNGKIIRELYEADKGEQDADAYASRLLDNLNPKTIKLFGRYIVWFSNHTEN